MILRLAKRILPKGLKRKIKHVLGISKDYSVELTNKIDDLNNHINRITINLSSYNSRVDELVRCHYLHEMRFIGYRMDFCLIAFMIRNYYSSKDRYYELDPDGKKIVDYIFSEEFYWNLLTSRFFPFDLHMSKFVMNYRNQFDSKYPYPRINPDDYPVFTQNGDCYALLEGRKVFLMNNEESARRYWHGEMTCQLSDHPHCYLEENGDFNIKQGDIVADIGAAEGFFCIKYLDKIKHAYLFETEESWFELLKKTYEPFKEKITLVKGFVGDGDGNILLDEYFKDKEKPTFFKMDVEGAEGSVVRSMRGLLSDVNLPMRLAVCTYHRQEDAPYIESLLGKSFDIHYSRSYYWFMQDPQPPFLRHGVMRATKKKINKGNYFG